MSSRRKTAARKTAAKPVTPGLTKLVDRLCEVTFISDRLRSYTQGSAQRETLSVWRVCLQVEGNTGQIILEFDMNQAASVAATLDAVLAQNVRLLTRKK